mmetsp:Transcript_31523/g.62456  ORF Transcript_31523/g.62456 Transcript_31523/m.62456 type:complete len:209 (-) Transcript_31523:538-1164(-)
MTMLPLSPAAARTVSSGLKDNARTGHPSSSGSSRTAPSPGDPSGEDMSKAISTRHTVPSCSAVARVSPRWHHRTQVGALRRTTVRVMRPEARFVSNCRLISRERWEDDDAPFLPTGGDEKPGGFRERPVPPVSALRKDPPPRDVENELRDPGRCLLCACAARCRRRLSASPRRTSSTGHASPTSSSTPSDPLLEPPLSGGEGRSGTLR